MYTSPLVIDGVFYGLSPSLVPFALDAASGEEIWRRDLGIDGGAQRGLMWWANGDDKRLFFSQGKTLIGISAHNGELIGTFGAYSPKAALTALVSIESFSFVPVPCAEM